MSDDRPNIFARLWRACLLILGSVLCVWVALQLLAQIWIIVAIVLGVALLVVGLIWWLRARRNHW